MKISFDFDGTLADDFDGTVNEQKDKVVQKLKELQMQNHEIFIFTKRYSPENAGKGKVNEHIDVLRLAAELGISGKNVVFTNRQLKADKLVEMSIDQHYENSEHELRYYLQNFKNYTMNFIMVNRQPWEVVSGNVFDDIFVGEA
jgi:hydroxymethylpyrimidine pyrophosphatase-like HAD family hydrolase